MVTAELILIQVQENQGQAENVPYGRNFYLTVSSHLNTHDFNRRSKRGLDVVNFWLLL